MRKQPTIATVKKLFSLSGNVCAYPQCAELMVDDRGNVIGEICHIEAAEKGGERFNPKQTDDERRAFENLILLCPKHHTVTNDVKKYTAIKLKKIKSEHEKEHVKDKYDVTEGVVKGAIAKYSNVIINNANTIGNNNWGNGTQHIHQNFNFGNEVEAELNVIDTIFTHVLKKIHTSKSSKKSDRSLLALNKKIELNFSDARDREEVGKYFSGAYLKITLIESRFSSLSTNEQDDIHTHILGLYNKLVRNKLSNIEILQQLFDEFTPKGKEKDPAYTTLAKAFVLMFFEDCTIFEKVPKQNKLGGKSVNSNKARRPKT